MAEHRVTPWKEPPTHPSTDPLGPDTMPPQPRPPVGPSPKQKELLEKKKGKREGLVSGPAVAGGADHRSLRLSPPLGQRQGHDAESRHEERSRATPADLKSGPCYSCSPWSHVGLWKRGSARSISQRGR